MGPDGGSVRLSLLAVLLISVAGVASAADVGGVKLNERTELGASELILNGAGLQRRVFFKVYVAGLYLTEKKGSPADVLALDGPKRVSITMMRNLPTLKLVEALENGIGKNCSPEEREAVKDRVETLAATLRALRQARAGDVLTFDWLPDAGTLVALNGEAKGSAIPGDDVYRALLRVWLGDQPTNAGLKRALLGQTQG